MEPNACGPNVWQWIGIALYMFFTLYYVIKVKHVLDEILEELKKK